MALRSSPKRPNRARSYARSRLRRRLAAGVAALSLLSSASPARAQPAQLKRPEAAVHLLEQTTQTANYLKARIPAPVRNKIKRAKTVTQKARILENQLSPEEFSHVNALIETELATNPAIRDLRIQTAREREEARLNLLLVLFGVPTGAIAGVAIGRQLERRRLLKQKR